MTLSRQLLTVIVTVFILGFFGTFAISVDNTREFLINQLESHAQDTATSLGLSLSPHMRDNDLPSMNSMIDAIFDRGYYKEVTLRDINGGVLIERNNPLRFEGVPAWFVKLIPLATPEGEALVMSGWRQAGTVHVTSNPGYAYHELWSNSIQTLWLFTATALGTLLVGMLLLRFVLRPLRAVEQQANAICARDYRVQEQLPRTRELKSVVSAMNRMSLKVKQMFEDESMMTERLREQAYKDPVTGLGNRRYFDTQLQHRLQSQEESAHGALALIQLQDFKAYNEQYGYAEGDALLRKAAGLLNETCAALPEAMVTRLTGADFAVLAADLTPVEADRFAESLSHALLRLRPSLDTTPAPITNTGITLYHTGRTAGDLIAAADMALRAAQSRGANNWHRYDDTLQTADIHGAADWQTRLEKVIADGAIALHLQPVVKAQADNTVMHREALLRMTGDDGQPLAAGVFMPMAERLGLARALDKLAVTRLLTHIETHADGDYAINLSPAAIHTGEFVDWLFSTLSSRLSAARRLVFEISEYGVLGDIGAMRRFNERVAAVGAGCAIDHFGRGFTSFGYLRSLKVRYLKIDGSYIHAINASKDNQFFVQSLIRTAHSIDIEVIAESVETAAERDTLQSMQIDGLQGYLIGRPEPSSE